MSTNVKVDPADIVSGNPVSPDTMQVDPADIAPGDPERLDFQPQVMEDIGTVGADGEPPGFFDIFTGKSRMTPEMEESQEIGAAPELNELSMRAFKASMGLLATGDTESLKQILNAQFPDVRYSEDAKGNTMVHLPSGSYALNKPGASPQDFIRAAFDIASFTPAGRAASIAGAVGKSTLTATGIEAAEAAAGSTPDIGDVTDVALAGGLGGAGKAIETGLQNLYRIARGSPVNEVVNLGEQFGVPVQSSDIYPPTTFATRHARDIAEKVPFIGTAGARETQQEARMAAVREVTDRYGDFSYESIVNSLKGKKTAVKRAAGSALESVGRRLDPVGEVPLENTAQAIDDAMDILTRPGIKMSDAAMSDLQTIMNTLGEADQTFTMLKENRTAFREMIEGIDKAERTQLPSFAKTKLSQVVRAIGDDMDEFAKENLTTTQYRQWKNANAVYAEEAKLLTKTRLKNILDRGDITPEIADTMLFSKKPSEVQRLYQSLGNRGRTQARSAIIHKMVDTLESRAGGLTPNAFASQMKKQKLQIDTFFKGNERRELNGLLKLLDSTRRAQEAGVITPTGQSLWGFGLIGAAGMSPTATTVLGSIPFITKVMESPTARNMLIKINSAPKGSIKFDQAVAALQEHLTPIAQSYMRGQTDIEGF